MALPLPKVVADVGPGGGIVTARQGINALTKSGLENQIYNAKAQYAPYTEYANANSKIAYSQMAPAMALAQFMSGPGAANMSREQAQAFATQMQNYLKNIPNMASILPPPSQVNENGYLGKAINYLSNKIMPSSSLINPMVNPARQESLVNNNEDQLPSNYSSSIQSSEVPAQTNTGVGIGQLPYNKTANNLPIPGTQGGLNSGTGAKAQQNAIVKGVEGEIEVQKEMWKQMHTEAAKEAIATQRTNDLVDEFSNAYDRTSKWEKGPLKGQLPPWFSEAADTADRASNGMANAVARAEQQGHITQADRSTYKSIKFDRSMRPETKENAVAFIKGMNERTREHAAFLVDSQKKGLTPQEANIVWSDYINKNPFYSAKEHRLITENFNKWPQYLSNEKINEALHPKQNNKNNSNLVLPKDKIRVKNIETGQIGLIPINRLEVYEANGYEKV